MVTIKKCAFCGRDIEPGTGKMLVDHSGAVAFYCSSKCEKNVELGRSSRKVRWTQAFRKEKAIRVQHLKDTVAAGPKSTEKKTEDSKPKTVKPEAPKAEKSQKKKE